MASNALDIVLFSLFSFLGTSGVAITGFGMAIIYLFFWQIAVLAGYSSDFKYAIFIQALSLLCAQPLLIYKAQIWKHASRKMLLYIIPITIISTPLGNYTAEHITTYVVELVGGFLVIFVAVLEVFQRRQMFLGWARHLIRKVTCGRCFAKNDYTEGKGDNAGGQEAQDIGKKANSDINEKGDNAGEQEAQDVDKKENSGINESDKLESQQHLGDSTSEQEKEITESYTFFTIFWTLLAGFSSGYLGGLCGIRGPPLIIYFLHLPHPIVFKTKQEQRATGASITLANVVMRVIYYMIDTLAFDKHSYFTGEDWGLYLSVAIFSLLGVIVGAKIFDLLSDKKDAVKGILTIFLLLCGISLLISSFTSIKN